MRLMQNSKFKKTVTTVYKIVYKEKKFKRGQILEAASLFNLFKSLIQIFASYLKL